jgi:hypothetical protein
MGLLDDAIRDHLDLKRRRGADPGEVERAEREALGPVRRNPTPAELEEMEAAADGAPVPDGAFAYDQAGDDSWSHDSLQEPAGEAGVEPLYDEAPVQPPPEFPAQEGAPPRGVDDHPPLEPLEDELLEEEAPFDEDPFEEERPRESVPAEREPSAPPTIGGVGPETAEYNVEDVLAAEDDAEGGDGEDVLEETPEFLQDTPDHDRLWFEQRPPKDFDFDE